jgi:hypothetical protein
MLDAHFTGRPILFNITIYHNTTVNNKPKIPNRIATTSAQYRLKI